MLAMNRRSLLYTLASAPAALAARELPRIAVEKLEIFRVKVNRRGNWVIARVTATGGVTGLGDASHHGAGDDAQMVLLQRFFERFKGAGIFDLERLRGEIAGEIAGSGKVAAAVAWSALEQCLWDIRGKVLGVPVYELLGGMLHPRIRNYANINRSTEERVPRAFAAMAERAVAAGFDAVKLAPFDGMKRPVADPRPGIECVEAVRKAIGGRDLLVDAHNYFDLEGGLALARRFEPLNLFWLEEVTPRTSLSNLAAINRAAKMPTAGGESIFGVKGFFPYIAAGAVDIAMPDVKYCGGVLELKKIAAMAEGAGLPVSPHGPASPVGNVAAAHVCATLPNFLILEIAFGEVPWRAELIDPPEALPNGRMELSRRPGFGITLNEKTAAKYAV